MKTLTLITFLLLVKTFFCQVISEKQYNEWYIEPAIKEYKSVNFDSLNQVTIKKINSYRKQKGLNLLTQDTSLMKYAHNWSNLCISKKEGTRHSDITKNGIVCENLHVSYGINPWISGKELFLKIPDEVFYGWRNSDGHNINMLTQNVTKIGFNIATYMDGYNYRLVCVMVLK